MTRRKAKQELGKYRSKLEMEIGETLEDYGFEYEPFPVAYHVPRKYTPDWVWHDLYIELKGYFRAGDTQKYKAISDSLVEAQLVFLLQTPNKKIRKGAKQTMAEWCEKHGILWFKADAEGIDALTDFMIAEYDWSEAMSLEDDEDDDE